MERAKEAVEGFIDGLEKAGESVPEEVTPVELVTQNAQMTLLFDRLFGGVYI